MIHIIAVVLTLAWLFANFYVWHVVRSQELLLAASTVLGAAYYVPFWLYVTHESRPRIH
jgi:hypothetical protein